MLDKFTEMAEKVGDKLSISRRGFLTSAGKTAAVLAGAVGGLLAAPTRAKAMPECFCVYDGSAAWMSRANCFALGGTCE